MNAFKTKITRADILSMDDYAPIRKERRVAITTLKKNRRVHVGPDATFYFESFDTMWHQIHEMLYIEGGGEAQIDDEIMAYNPLVPNGAELVATLMFEVEDEVRRAAFLANLGGAEETVTIEIGDHIIKGVPEADIDRTTADGKASAVQFIHFPFTPDQIAAFKAGDKRIVLSINHATYGHMAALTPDVQMALSTDFS